MAKEYRIDYQFIADGKIGKESIEAASVPTSKRGMEQMLRLRGGETLESSPTVCGDGLSGIQGIWWRMEECF